MGLLAAILLVVWLVGIAYLSYNMGQFMKEGEGDLHERFTSMAEAAPGIVYGLLTVLIVFWPGTLLVSIATRRKK